MILSDSNLNELFFEEEKIYTFYNIASEKRLFDDEMKRGFMLPQKTIGKKLIIDPIPKKINPSGFDLTLADYVALSDTFHSSISENELANMGFTKIKSERFVFENDEEGKKVYYVLTNEKINLPRNLEMVIDACSTTGRVGCLIHKVGKTSVGRQILAIQPFSFPIEITFGETTPAQAIIRNKGTDFVSPTELKGSKELKISYKGKDVLEKLLKPEGLTMTISTNLIYKSKKNKNAIDMDLREEIDPKEYFEIIEGNSKFKMEAKSFYLAATREIIELGNLCGRLSRMSHTGGPAFMSDFAGYFHPGFIGGITLECYSFINRVIEEGNPIGIVTFDEIKGAIKKSIREIIKIKKQDQDYLKCSNNSKESI